MRTKSRQHTHNAIAGKAHVDGFLFVVLHHIVLILTIATAGFDYDYFFRTEPLHQYNRAQAVNNRTYTNPTCHTTISNNAFTKPRAQGHSHGQEQLPQIASYSVPRHLPKEEGKWIARHTIFSPLPQLPIVTSK